ncbi:ATP-dependent DNA helicase pif1 [Eumeta japonica]|uniref:ATP-dependent DNA helicase n=1 Tax=Eumeta variegata TaxID=151549 RepID=A0A4C1YKY8_EUMVA|nr:ATP-dependent DNA helicase pif1 [Eumeta japonica]
MVHGPCGALNPLSPCMADGKCTKRYPRPLVAETVTGNDGYPVYRRRSKEDNGRTIKVKVQNQEIEIGNEFIVPYCPLLSRIFETHANVESCHSAKSIKYLCNNFQMGRYVSTNEALWRLLSFQIHERYPTVVHLAVHLENGQRVYFTEANAAQRAERPPSTTLTSFAMCEADPFAATLMYVEMPKYYTWNQSTKKFQRRKQGTPVPDWPQVFSTDALGRMYTVHPRNDECFICDCSCQLLGLLENDSHWDLTLADSVVSSNAYQIRTLFAIIITTCFPSQPIQLWNKYKDAICEDILHRLRIQTNNPDIQITDEIYNEGLILIEDQCLTIANKLLIEVGMIAPNRSMHDSFNQELNRELQYNVDTLQEFVRNNVPLLNEQQKQVYETLMQAVDNNTGGLFFLDAPGGTGKTFVISLILATIRSRCDIALALAFDLLLHSALKLPLNLNTIDTPTCNISRSSAMGKLLMQCKLIVWDECTMAHKKSLEALNFTLKDLRRNNNIFGGLMILLAGDFRQTLPVVPRGTPADELNACLKASPLWNNVKKLSLTTNMRVQLQNDQSAAQFSKQLLDVGNGKVPVDATSGLITLTNDFCRFVDTQLVLIENVFPNISENYKNYAWLSQRAILAAKNNDVHALNFTIQSKLLAIW